tara:strand:- start:132 stop:1937 length:1806 start_codon:yes stop_codon:yes gene_type:complete
MAQAQLIEEEVPAGGIADFIMTAEEIADLEKEEAKEAFGSAGIANFEDVAKRMASYGRYGDDKVAHVETGELLVPRALIEGNPELKESIFGHLREMGIENPERYVVGSGENSINPDTGLPEFFFKSIRRAVSKIGKSVSKAVSKVGKVLKKIAPAVLTVVGTAAFGPMYGAAFGSGIGTLIQGGNIKDALKSALTAGAMGAVSAGLSSKFSGGTFMGGMKNAAKLGNVSAGIESIGKAATGDFSGFSMKNMSQGPTAEGGTAYQTPAAETIQNVASSDVPVTPGQEIASATDVTYSPTAVDPGANMKLNSAGELVMAPTGDLTGVEQFAKGAPGYVDTSAAYASGAGATPVVDPGAGLTLDAGGNLVPVGTAEASSGFVDSLKETGQNVLDFFDPRVPDTVPGLEAEVTRLKGLGYTDDVALKIAQENVAKATPGFIERYGPLAVAGTGAAALGGFFEPTPVEEPNLVNERTGADLLAENPEQYRLSPEARTPSLAQGPFTVGTNYGPFSPPSLPPQMRNPFVRPEMYAEDGGQVFPRRTGGIMPNEGVPDEDSVRALLMPGEFVMTKKAVKGLGNGNMTRGINNMYSMMRNLENKGQMMS